MCMAEAPGADYIIMAAAVADYTCATIASSKLKKSQTAFTLELLPTKDILSEIGKKKKKNQVLVGFALETDHEIENAKRKLTTKNLDYIVLNSLKDTGAGFGYGTNKVSIMDASGAVYHGSLKSKQEVAEDILDIICKLRPM